MEDAASFGLPAEDSYDICDQVLCLVSATDCYRIVGMCPFRA